MNTSARSRRLALGLSQQEMAERAGISQPTVSQVENGYRPGAETRRRIADALNVSEAELFPQHEIDRAA